MSESWIDKVQQQIDEGVDHGATDWRHAMKDSIRRAITSRYTDELRKTFTEQIGDDSVTTTNASGGFEPMSREAILDIMEAYGNTKVGFEPRPEEVANSVIKQIEAGWLKDKTSAQIQELMNGFPANNSREAKIRSQCKRELARRAEEEKKTAELMAEKARQEARRRAEEEERLKRDLENPIFGLF